MEIPPAKRYTSSKVVYLNDRENQLSSEPDADRAELVRTVQAAARGLHNAVDTLNQTVADQLGVNRTDLRCIQMLGQFGPRTAGQLAEASGLTTGAVTSVIDRIERANFARRVRDEVDRRRVYVELTPSSGQRMFAIYRDLVTSSAASVEGYSDAELLLIREFLQRGREVTLAHVERVKAMPNDPERTARPAEPPRPA
jgi:DNA-binding MarR family transcriptional regulator